MNASQHYSSLISWLKSNAFLVQFREETSVMTLKDVASNKSLTFDTRRLKDTRLVNHPQGLGQYLNVLLDDDSQFVLCHAGIAFSPNFVNTGFLQDAPPVACIRDFYQLHQQLLSILPDPETPQPVKLLTIQVLISILDGAKAIGFETSAEEALLDGALTQLENNNSK